MNSATSASYLSTAGTKPAAKKATKPVAAPPTPVKPAEHSDAGGGKTVKGNRFFLACTLGAIGLGFSYNSAISTRIQTAVYTPNGNTSTEPLDNMLFMFACMGMCGLFDTVIAARFGSARYFVLHVAVNVFTIAFSYRDFLVTMTSPAPFSLHSCATGSTYCCNKAALDMAAAATLWHSLAYALKPIDWIHHVPALIVSAIGIFFPWGPSLNAAGFVLMGLPGGLDYLMLVFVKLKVLPSLVEKNYNQTLNVWFRAPLSAHIGVMQMLGIWLTPEHFPTTVHWACALLFGFHTFWNGAFFMYRTVDARTRFVTRQAELKKASAE